VRNGGQEPRGVSRDRVHENNTRPSHLIPHPRPYSGIERNRRYPDLLLSSRPRPFVIPCHQAMPAGSQTGPPTTENTPLPGNLPGYLTAALAGTQIVRRARSDSPVLPTTRAKQNPAHGDAGRHRGRRPAGSVKTSGESLRTSAAAVGGGSVNSVRRLGVLTEEKRFDGNPGCRRAGGAAVHSRIGLFPVLCSSGVSLTCPLTTRA